MKRLLLLALCLAATPALKARDITRTYETFDMQWSGAPYMNGATAFGTITMDTTALAGTPSIMGPFGSTVSDLSITVTGATQNNGTYGLADFEGWVFVAPGGVDFSQNLVGQAGVTEINFIGHFPGPGGTGVFTLSTTGKGGEPMRLISFSHGSPAITSAQTSGLAFGNATGQSVMNGMQGVLGDINGHLFSLRAGGEDDGDNGGLAASLDEGVEMGQGDGPEGGKGPVAHRVTPGSQWEVFTTVNFANVSLDTMGTQPGVDSYTWSPGVGVEKRVAPGLRLGFAANLVESHQTYSNNLGTLETEGFALSTYASYVKRDYWIDLLYSFGRLELESDRNPGFAFPMAQGETTAFTNAVQLNGGWKFQIPACKVTHGPFAGVDYLNVKVDSYNEVGGGAAALAYASRSIDSLITRVGYSVSQRIDAGFATITPQLRVSYERQNISNNNGTSVNLINQAFTASSNAQSPGQDYLVAGAGVNFQFTPTLSLMLTYQGQFFRSDLQAHYAGARLGWTF